jgi:hypothetical protein
MAQAWKACGRKPSGVQITPPAHFLFYIMKKNQVDLWEGKS